MAIEEVRKAPFVIEWRDGFKINIAQVDDEHRRLFQLVKALDLRTVEQTLEGLEGLRIEVAEVAQRETPAGIALDTVVLAVRD